MFYCNINSLPLSRQQELGINVCDSVRHTGLPQHSSASLRKAPDIRISFEWTCP